MAGLTKDNDTLGMLLAGGAGIVLGMLANPARKLAVQAPTMLQGRWDEAEGWLHRAITQGAGAEAWEELGDGLAVRGDDALARQCYANALRAARGEPLVPIVRNRDGSTGPALELDPVRRQA